MPTISYNRSSQGFGPAIASAETRKTPCGILINTVVPKGHSGSLTTRTNNTTGVVTLNAGHGLASGTFDLYWADGKRRDVIVNIVGDAASFPSTGPSSGQNLPAQGTSVVLSPRHTFEFPFSPTSLDFMAIQPVLSNGSYGVAGRLSLYSIPDDADPGNDVILHIELISGRLIIFNVVEGEYSNPFAAFDGGTHMPLTWTMSNGSNLFDMTFNATMMFDPTSESSS